MTICFDNLIATPVLVFTFHWLVQRFCEPHHENSIIKDESLEKNFGKLSRSNGIVEEQYNFPPTPPLLAVNWQSISIFSVGGG